MNRKPSVALAQCGICVVLVLLPVACGGDSTPRKIPLLEPFQYLRIHSHREVSLALTKDSEVSDFCNLDAFAGLKPGLTKKEAEALLGPSTGTRRERQDLNEVYLFPREGGVIEIVRQRAASSDGKESFFRWFVRFAPADPEIEHHLVPSVVNLLRVAEVSSDYSVQIFNESASVELDIQSSRVQRIWWLHDGVEELLQRSIEIEEELRGRWKSEGPGK